MSEEDLEEFKAAAIRRSIENLFREGAPGSNPARIALVVREAYRHLQRPIRREELMEFFAHSGVPLPSNFSRDLAKAVESTFVYVVELEDSDGEGFVPQAMAKKLGLS